MKIKGLTKTINNEIVLDNINLILTPGEITGLIARNGVGKTTFFRCLNHHYHPDKGQLLINDQDIKQTLSLKEKMFFIDEQYNFLTSYTLKVIHSFYQEAYPLFDTAEYNKLMKKFQLSPQLHYRNLSKGMQGLYKIILAVSSQAEYLFLDEPFDGLDAIVKRDIIQLIIDSMSNGTRSIVIASHNLNELENLIDRSLFLIDGHIKNDFYLEKIRETSKKIQFASDSETVPLVIRKYGHILSKQGRVLTVFFPKYSMDIKQLLLDEAPLFFEELAFSLEDLLRISAIEQPTNKHVKETINE